MEGGHQHDVQSHSQSQRQLLLAFGINSVFVVVEFIGGLLTNSVAILSDAVHDLGDCFALGTAWYFERISGKRRTTKYTYGYRRYSVLGAVINAIVLITGSVFIIREAIIRLNAPEEVHSTGMMLLAVIGILMNGFAFSRIHKGHSHNVEVVRLHLLEDVLGWVAVLLGAIAIYLWDLTILDPLLSLTVSAWILFQVIRRVTRSLRIMLQVAPPEVDLEAVNKTVLALPGVHSVHDTHIWTMDSEYHVLTIHVVVDRTKTLGELSSLKGNIRNAMTHYRVSHVTIEFEYEGEDCGYDDC